MVDKRDFYTVNVWKKQISRRTLVQSASPNVERNKKTQK